MIIQEIKNLLGKQLGIDPAAIQDDACVIKDLNADSLDVLEIIMVLEKHFKIEIASNSLEEFTTVQQIADYIVSRS
jgi:acyl carrier protein